jgi:hypothetical protein
MWKIKLFILIIVFSLPSCDILIKGSPPFVITTPVCELADNSSEFTHAGLLFHFKNKSNKDISSITVSFMLFDFKIQTSPFIGSNLFEIKKVTFISSGENTRISLSLDRFIYITPTEPYLIDFFYISRIEYTNGSIWEDKYGAYIEKKNEENNFYTNNYSVHWLSGGKTY